MANELVTVTPLTLNGAVLNPTGVTIEATNVAIVSRDAGAADGSGHDGRDQVEARRLVLRVSSATGHASAATVLAGDNPPAGASSQGNLVVALGAGETKWVVVEGYRFTQDNGAVHVLSGVADLVVAALYMV